MRALKFTVAAVLSTLSDLAMAQVITAPTVSFMYENCLKSSMRESHSSGLFGNEDDYICGWWIHGVAGALRALEGTQLPRAVCLPKESVQVTTYRRIFLDYVKAHATPVTEWAGKAMLAGLQEAFPCKNEM